MNPRTEIVNNRVVNSVEQLACFLRPGDVFRRPRSNTPYLFTELLVEKKIVVCMNTLTLESEEIYSNSPVFRLLVI
jgi:hypothetical protein